MPVAWQLLQAARLTRIIQSLQDVRQLPQQLALLAVLLITSKGGEADFQPVAITDDAMDAIAKAMGCPVESLTFDPYPG